MNRALMMTREIKRLLAIACLEDLVAGHSQAPRRERANCIVVFGDEHRLVAMRAPFRDLRLASRLDHGIDRGEHYAKCRSATGRAVDGDRATRLLDASVHRG